MAKSRQTVGKSAAARRGAVPTKRTPAVRPQWTFLTNHSHVLICLWRDPTARLRDVADRVGITERAVQAIVADLEAGGVLTRHRDGRRNHYEIHDRLPLRHPVEASRPVAALLAMVGRDPGIPPKGSP